MNLLPGNSCIILRGLPSGTKEEMLYNNIMIMGDMFMPTKEWMEKYELKKDDLCCKVDLDAYFTEKKIQDEDLDILDIGTVHFPTGTILACDPLTELGEARPFLQTVPAGTYPASICVCIRSERYACVKVAITDHKPVRYDMGVVGNEDLDENLEEDEYFGFSVDAGMGGILDIKTQEEFNKYWAQREAEEEDIDVYNDLFYDLLEENSKVNPKYQQEEGDWVNWEIPETDCNILIFTAGWGDGVYPTYFGFDNEGKICSIYIWLIDLAKES